MKNRLEINLTTREAQDMCNGLIPHRVGKKCMEGTGKKEIK